MERLLLCKTCSGGWIGAPASSCPFCRAGLAEAERNDLARALFRIRSLTMRGRGDQRVADIACEVVRSIDETPLFEPNA